MWYHLCQLFGFIGHTSRNNEANQTEFLTHGKLQHADLGNDLEHVNHDASDLMDDIDDKVHNNSQCLCRGDARMV